jgi:hypothetical protein
MMMRTKTNYERVEYFNLEWYGAKGLSSENGDEAQSSW